MLPRLCCIGIASGPLRLLLQLTLITQRGGSTGLLRTVRRPTARLAVSDQASSATTMTTTTMKIMGRHSTMRHIAHHVRNAEIDAAH